MSIVIALLGVIAFAVSGFWLNGYEQQTTGFSREKSISWRKIFNSTISTAVAYVRDLDDNKLNLFCPVS